MLKYLKQLFIRKDPNTYYVIHKNHTYVDGILTTWVFVGENNNGTPVWSNTGAGHTFSDYDEAETVANRHDGLVAADNEI